MENSRNDIEGISSRYESIQELKKIQYALDTSSIIAITDRKGVITYVNDKFCELSKYTEGELIGQTHRILNSGYHSKQYFTDLWNTISNGDIWEGQLRNKAKDGSHYWVETVIVPLLDDEGDVQQYVSIRRDITKRKELAMQALLWDRVFQHMNEGIIITDAAGNILNVNKAYCSITGYTKDELVGNNPRIVKSQVHDETFYQSLWNKLRMDGYWEGEIWNRHKNGQIYLQKLYMIAVRDERNTTIFYVGVSTDISEEERIRKDMIRTGKLQKSLLPPPLQDDLLEVQTIYAPSDYISGDFFDYYWDKEHGILSGYLLDIMGHGMTAAYQNSILRVLFEQNFRKNGSLVDVLTTINIEAMNYFFEDTFAAALCFRLDVNKRTLTYACAGINKYLKVNSKGDATIVKQAGPYIGILEHPSFEEMTVPLLQDESIYFMTDGFMDLMDSDEPVQLTGNYQSNLRRFENEIKGGLKDDASLIGIYAKRFGGNTT